MRHICHGFYGFVQEALVPRHATAGTTLDGLFVAREVESRTWLHLRRYRVDSLQVALCSIAACGAAFDRAGVLLARHLAGLEARLVVLDLLSLFLISLLHLQLELFTVVVCDEGRRDQTMRVQLRRRENHLVWGHEQELVLQVLLLLLLLLDFARASIVHWTSHIRRGQA